MISTFKSNSVLLPPMPQIHILQNEARTSSGFTIVNSVTQARLHKLGYILQNSNHSRNGCKHTITDPSEQNKEPRKSPTRSEETKPYGNPTTPCMHAPTHEKDRQPSKQHLQTNENSIKKSTAIALNDLLRDQSLVFRKDGELKIDNKKENRAENKRWHWPGARAIAQEIYKFTMASILRSSHSFTAVGMQREES